MNSGIKKVEASVQDAQARMAALWKVLMLVIATGSGASAAVQAFLFANWEAVAPLAQGSHLGLVLVASGATLVVFVASAWLCLNAGVFSQAVSALRGRGRLSQAPSSSAE